MSDQALLWKFAFGSLVLVFSAATYVARKDAEPLAAMTPATAAVPAAPAPAFAPSAAPEPAPVDTASLSQPAPESPPADLPEAQEAPVRIHIAMDPPPRDKGPAAGRLHNPGKHTAAPKLHVARGTRPHPSRTRHASPYAIGRQHYPFEPHDRWRTRDG